MARKPTEYITSFWELGVIIFLGQDFYAKNMKVRIFGVLISQRDAVRINFIRKRNFFGIFKNSTLNKFSIWLPFSTKWPFFKTADLDKKNLPDARFSKEKWTLERMVCYCWSDPYNVLNSRMLFQWLRLGTRKVDYGHFDVSGISNMLMTN